jgi:hypothetical protein
MEYIFRWGVWPLSISAGRVEAALADRQIQAMSAAAVRVELSRVERACFTNGFDLDAFGRLGPDDVERIIAVSCLARSRGISHQPSPLPPIEADQGYVRNYYRCSTCQWTWDDIWSCGVDDDCPACGTKHLMAIITEPAGPLPPWVLFE